MKHRLYFQAINHNKKKIAIAWQAPIFMHDHYYRYTITKVGKKFEISLSHRNATSNTEIRDWNSGSVNSSLRWTKILATAHVNQYIPKAEQIELLPKAI